MTEYDRQLEELFGRVYQKAYRTAKSICFSHHLAEDAVSEAAVRMLNAFRRGHVRANADHYFIKIVVNEAKRLCSKQKEMPIEDVTTYLDARGSFAEQERESMRLLMEAISRLNDKLKLPVQMHYFGGFSEAETAKLLGISYSAVKARIMRGRQRLKEILERENYLTEGAHHEI